MHKVIASEAKEFVELNSIIVERLAEYISETSKRTSADEPISLGSSAAELKLPNVPKAGLGKDGVVQLLDLTLAGSVRTWSGKFYDKLYAGSNSVGCLTEMIISLLNTNVHVYKVSPMFTRMELFMVSELGKMFGYQRPGGVFCPGGSYSNLHAMLTARNSRLPELADSGVSSLGKTLVVFTSAHCHYSISKSAIALGIGLNNVIGIKTDATGHMCTEDLQNQIEKALAEDKIPVMVNATAGTTVYGAFDPIDRIAELCKKHQIWLHIDASWGGAAIFSAPHKHLLKGCEKADSITFNPHKMLGIPMLCSVLLTKDRFILEKTQSIRAPYLFHCDDEQDSECKVDMGNRTLSCSRRADCLKLYMSWMYYGTEGFSRRVQVALENSRQFVQDLKSFKSTSGSVFKLVIDKYDYTNVCFWYVPAKKRAVFEAIEKLNPNSIATVPKELGEYTREIHEKIVARGNVMVDYMTVENPERKELPSFFRMVFINPRVRSEEYFMVIREIEHIGSMLYC